MPIDCKRYNHRYHADQCGTRTNYIHTNFLQKFNECSDQQWNWETREDHWQQDIRTQFGTEQTSIANNVLKNSIRSQRNHSELRRIRFDFGGIGELLISGTLRSSKRETFDLFEYEWLLLPETQPANSLPFVNKTGILACNYAVSAGQKKVILWRREKRGSHVLFDSLKNIWYRINLSIVHFMIWRIFFRLTSIKMNYLRCMSVVKFPSSFSIIDMSWAHLS